MKSILTAIVFALLFFTIPFGYAAAQEDTDSLEITEQETRDEINRQIDELDLSEWREYFDRIGEFNLFGFDSIDAMIEAYAQSGSGATADSIWALLFGLIKTELRDSLGAIAAIAAAALLTGLAGIVSDEGIRPVLSLALCTLTILLVTSSFASLAATAADAVAQAAKFTQAVLPVMSVLLAALGATASAGIFRPLMLFLSSTVVSLIEKAVLPISLAGGVLNVIDGLTDRLRIGELVKLCHKSAKWLLGLISTLYFGVTAVQGMSVAATDGVSVRTAKYALDKLVPVVGSMVSGTVDSVMGCALLVKNAAGVVSIVVMFAMLAGPLIKLIAGIFIFRAAAAIAQPAADPRISRMLSGAADAVTYLFAAVAVTGCMFAVTMLVFIAAGGISAGLW